MKWLLIRLSTRKCRKGCMYSGVHTHHLSAFGRWRYTRGDGTVTIK